MKKLNEIKYKKLLIAFILLTLVLVTIVYIIKAIESDTYTSPNYDKINITSILLKDDLSEEDYKVLFYQTGLGKSAIDEILKSKEAGLNEILKFQEDFFTDVNTLWEKTSVLTKRESIIDHNGRYKYGFNLAPYDNGYVLITKSNHSLGWLHGHAAIITNSSKNEVLEAVTLGQNSKTLDINDWRIYPSFIMLKLKDEPKKTLNKIAAFANDNMNDVPYSLTVGLFSPKNPTLENLKGTHCSHLVWYAFNHFGYHIDSKWSLLITPKDILNSDLFEVVQIYGVDPENIWP